MKIDRITYERNFHADLKDRFLMEKISVEANIDPEENAKECLGKLRAWMIANAPVLEGNPTIDKATINGQEVTVGDAVALGSATGVVESIKKAPGNYSPPDWSSFEYIYTLPYAKKGYDMAKMRNKLKDDGAAFNGESKKWYSHVYYEDLREFVTTQGAAQVPLTAQTEADEDNIPF